MLIISLLFFIKSAVLKSSITAPTNKVCLQESRVLVEAGGKTENAPKIWNHIELLFECVYIVMYIL